MNYNECVQEIKILKDTIIECELEIVNLTNKFPNLVYINPESFYQVDRINEHLISFVNDLKKYQSILLESKIRLREWQYKGFI